MTFHIIGPWGDPQIFRVWQFFSCSPLKFAIQTCLCYCPQYLWLFGIVCECIPSFHDQGMMLVLPNQLLCWGLSTSDQDLVSFQPIWCHPHTQIRIILFHDVRISIPNLETFSQPYLKTIFSNCFSHNSPAKRWPYRSRSRKNDWVFHTGPWFWPMCVVVHESICLDILIWELSVIWVHLPFLPGYKSRRCVRCLYIANPSSHALFSEYCIRPRFVFYNSTSEHNSTFVFLVLCLQFSIFQMTYVHQRGKKWTFAPFVLASSTTSYLLLTFVRFHAESFSNFPIPCPPLLLLREFS